MVAGFFWWDWSPAFCPLIAKKKALATSRLENSSQGDLILGSHHLTTVSQNETGFARAPSWLADGPPNALWDTRCLIDNRDEVGKGKATVGSRTKGLRKNGDGTFYMLPAR